MMLHLFGVWERKKFAVRRGENTRQTRSLLCVFFRAHGKVFFKKMMLHLVGVWERKKNLPCVVEKTHIKHDLCRAFSLGARQITSLPCAQYKMHEKDFDACQTRIFP
jgi:hypothetical protein